MNKEKSKTAVKRSERVGSYNFACGNCENCKFIYQDEDDKKDGGGVCSLFTDNEYFKENKIDIQNSNDEMGAIGVGEDGWAYGYFCVNDIKKLGCWRFESKQ